MQRVFVGAECAIAFRSLVQCEIVSHSPKFSDPMRNRVSLTLSLDFDFFSSLLSNCEISRIQTSFLAAYWVIVSYRAFVGHFVLSDYELSRIGTRFSVLVLKISRWRCYLYCSLCVLLNLCAGDADDTVCWAVNLVCSFFALTMNNNIYYCSFVWPTDGWLSLFHFCMLQWQPVSKPPLLLGLHVLTAIWPSLSHYYFFTPIKTYEAKFNQTLWVSSKHNFDKFS